MVCKHKKHSTNTQGKHKRTLADGDAARRNVGQPRLGHELLAEGAVGDIAGKDRDRMLGGERGKEGGTTRRGEDGGSARRKLDGERPPHPR